LGWALGLSGEISGEGGGWTTRGRAWRRSSSREGIAEVALGGVDHALETGEDAVGGSEGVAERGLLVELEGGVHLVDEDLGFGGGEAAEGPSGTDQDVNEVALLRDSGAVALEVLFGEGGEMGGIFAGDGEGLGVDAGFQGIHGGTGLARGGAWARGGVGVGAAGAGFRRFHDFQ